MIRIGVIGYGYWGPNIVRNFHAVPGAKVTKICDKRPINVRNLCTSCKETTVTQDIDDLIKYIFVYFSDNLVAHFHVNWLSPVKVRETMIGGEKKMLIWDDVASDEKIKLYDRGAEVTSSEGIYNLMVNYRSGEIRSPRLDTREALSLECESFVNNVIDNTTPLSDGRLGLEVVKLLVACEKSIKGNGGMVLL